MKHTAITTVSPLRAQRGG